MPEGATALRDGDRKGVPVAELVPGDLVALASGATLYRPLRFQLNNVQKILDTRQGPPLEFARLNGRHNPPGV